MNPQSLRQLIEVSRAVGANCDYVQGGGGNTSVKSPDAKTLAIKASGTTLLGMSESAGWVELDLAALLSIFDLPGLNAVAPAEREATVLRHLKAAIVGGPGERPSVEAALHALLGPVVIHTHPPAVNALTCGPGEAAMAELARAGEPAPLWVPYTDPGHCLAVAVRAAIAEYEKRHEHTPNVLFLENHGIFCSDDTASGCLALHADWVGRCERYFAETAPTLRQPPAPAPSAVCKTMAWIRRAFHAPRQDRRAESSPNDSGAGRPVFARLSADPELANAAASSEASTILAHGALTPDQIVYTGAYSIYAKTLLEVAPALRASLDQPAPPRIVLVKNVGAFVVADDPAKLDVIEEVASSAAKVIRLAAGRGGARNLRHESAEFIIDWEVEHYRSKRISSEPKPLSGKVAVVTGAASGLGLGIAVGLAEAGAAVAFCDIDEPGLAAVAETACAPARALAVTMDVTDEAAVGAAFGQVIRHWGGVDIVVCAAGIAPPFELVDMPVDQWRRALEINLTGYFLVAREAARIMKAQGHGGAMVMVSSKSGLEASKANSAYNATKAGELHLMRGWALELGPDGIRVNAVAPGNVFEGSKIWNRDYIAACAKKKGIKPEEVIPYYVSLTALNREIKRSDVAAAVCFLCSEHARCITGQTLVVDSGQVMVR